MVQYNLQLIELNKATTITCYIHKTHIEAEVH